MMVSRMMDPHVYKTGAYLDDGTGSALAANGQGKNGGLLAAPQESVEPLEFDHQAYPSEVLSALGSLRRQNHFCDAVLRVGEREVAVHRAVLAASSPFLFDMFERASETHHNAAHHTSSMYKLKDISFTGFSYLLDYMYSGRLCVAPHDVGDVYRAAKILRMEQAAQACSAFLVDRLTPSNCLGIRMIAEDLEFRKQIDAFMAKNVESVINSKHFFGLSEIKMEIVGAEAALEDGAGVSNLFSLVMDWARASLDHAKPKVELLTEEINLLYLNAENHLQDCKDVNDSRMSNDDVIADYKKHSRRRSTATNKLLTGASEQLSPVNTAPSGQPMPFHVFSINPEGGVTQKEWSVVATMKQNGNAYMGLAVLAGRMTAISLHLRTVAPPASPEERGVVAPASPGTERCASLRPLEAMAKPRCAFGVCTWEDGVVVAGGYDRGECLTSVETYRPSQGRWSKLAKMLCPRARFGAAALQGCLYAIGGSDGAHDLDSVHRLNLALGQWQQVAALKKARSSLGVAELNGRLYCVGGSDGQRSLKSCEVYDPATNTWDFIAPLNTARSQAAVVAYNGVLLAVGGTDSWACLNTVEQYNPQTNAWTYLPSMAAARRGAAIEVVNDTVWVVGGSDGASSLRSTETYAVGAPTWCSGPGLNVARANAACVALGGDLYALGGFSGKKFLATLELLAADAHDWCCFQPATRRRSARTSNTSSGDDAPASPSSSTSATQSDSESSASDQDQASADEER